MTVTIVVPCIKTVFLHSTTLGYCDDGSLWLDLLVLVDGYWDSLLVDNVKELLIELLGSGCFARLKPLN